MVVLSLFRNEQRTQVVVDAIKAAGGNAIAVTGDISKKEVQKNIIDSAIKQYGRIDVLFNNAGGGAVLPFTATTEQVFDESISTNIKQWYFLTQYALPHLTATKGSVINNCRYSVLHYTY